MAGCDIQSGRLHDDCIEGIAGVKTVYFMKHSELSFTKNIAGEIITLGPATVFRFEQDEYHGTAIQEIVRGTDDTHYLRFQIDLTLFYMNPEFIYTINRLKAGKWAIFFLDYQDKIRLLGEVTPMYQINGIDQSGKAAGDNLYTNLAFQGDGSAYAPYLEDFTTFPFDNFPNIIVTPKYGALPGLLIYNNSSEHYKTDIFGNRLDYS